ncbi:MAG: electron transfer flavoprotein subunit alpha/FixB family protein [Candidatus Marinimicrobia bacterium]|nr:electron transfer flavoprotein subunit alpha/FixB family protein [Candidatus Neomarinimicrobiota bacterium]
MDYKGVWILGEQDRGKVQTVSYELLKRGKTLAEKLNVDLVAVLLGYQVSPAELESLIHYGADKVVYVDDPVFGNFLPDPYINSLTKLIDKYKPEILIASATSTGRTVAPAIAIKCHAGLTADCTGLDIEEGSRNLIQTRPAIGGNILATIKSPDHRPQMATVRPHSNQPMDPDPTRKGEVIYEKLEAKFLKSRSRQVAFIEMKEEGANIQDAEIVIAGGKGCKTEENFKMITELAKILNGAVGASREAVDLGWAKYPHQVGLSGKTVSPSMYLCAGISGAVQHLAGIKTAQNIVAINSDPDAQIFQLADIAVEADMFEFLPMLIEKLKARLNK